MQLQENLDVSKVAEKPVDPEESCVCRWKHKSPSRVQGEQMRS